MPAFEELSGTHFGDWLVVRLDHINRHGQSLWQVVCEACDLQKTIQAQHLKGTSRICPACRKCKRHRGQA